MAEVIALQEMRIPGNGRLLRQSCDIFYSGYEKRHEFGCGFAVSKRLSYLVSRFTLFSERLAAIRVKAKYFNISLICAHAPTEDKDDQTKEAFYDQLETLYHKCPKHDVKLVIDDFDAKVGREGDFGPMVRKDAMSDNGMRLISFAASQNMVISSTRFKHRNIHKTTWQFPDLNTQDQKYHVGIGGRHA